MNFKMLSQFALALLAVASLLMTPSLLAKGMHQQYTVVVLPPDGGADSFLPGFSLFAPLTDGDTIGVLADTSTPGVNNSYTWTHGNQTDLEALPQLPNLTGTNTYINWINQHRFAAGYGTRTDSITGASVENAAAWAPDGQILELFTPEGDQSDANWINDFGQVAGWISNSTPDSCFGAFSGTGIQTQAVAWVFGFMVPLGTLGGTNSFGAFTNDLGQVLGFSQTSNVPNPNTGCPPFEPFIWENGQLIEILPGNFGGAEGGPNFLNNQGQAVGFGDLYGDVDFHPFLWSKGVITDLFTVGNLGGGFGSAYNVSEKGHVIGISSLPGDAAFHAVLWNKNKFTDLHTLSAYDCSSPAGINSKDQIVGTSFPCGNFLGGHAFIWEKGELVDLNTLIPNTAGIQLVAAAWINEDGKIAAQGILTATGASRAVLLIPNGGWAAADQAASPASLMDPAQPQNSAGTGSLPRTFLKHPRHWTAGQ